jgi:hypothetical protein
MPIAEATSDEVKDATIVGEANSVLRKLAMESKDELLIGAAHVLESLWIMLRARDKIACETMARFARLAVAYRTEYERQSLDGLPTPIDLNEMKQLILHDRSTIEELPSKGGLDRHLNAATLYRFTQNLWVRIYDLDPNVTVTPYTPIAEQDPVRAAAMFIGMVQILFPDIGSSVVNDIDAFTKKVADAWKRRARLLHARDKRIDAAIMVVDGLKAIGLSHNKANNWIRSMLNAITNGKDSPKREQGRGAQGRFGSGRNTAKTKTGPICDTSVDGTSK